MTPLLDVPAVARILDVSESFVRTHASELGAVRLPGTRGRLRFEEQRVRAFLDQHRVTPPEPVQRRRPGRRRGYRAGMLLPLPKDAL